MTAARTLAGVAGVVFALVWATPGAASTHTIPPARIAAARQLLQEADKRAAALPAGKDRTERLLAIAGLRARLGDVDPGLRELAAAPRPYDFSMREAVEAIAAAQALRGDVPGALAHVAALASDPDANMAAASVAAALARAGRPADGLSAVGSARGDGGQDGVVAAVAIGLIEAGDRPAALTALRAARQAAGPRSRELEAFLLARDGKTAEAERLGAGLADDIWEFGFVQRAHAQARAGDVAGARTT